MDLDRATPVQASCGGHGDRDQLAASDRLARRQAGLAQTELARRAGTSQAAVSAYESGRPASNCACDSRRPTHTPPHSPPPRLSCPREAPAAARTVPDLDVGMVVRVLNRHHVRYVVICGFAAQLHDLPVSATVDIHVNSSARTPRISSAWHARSTNSTQASTQPRRRAHGSREHRSSCGRSTTPCT